ncbi:hypothetical protein E3T54_04350 [Cryobacterium sp. Sr8]|uniref:hypothetical protein n=1 Tax=Cryobacterium sp. Sr8 TaxID=1259203 RepID=UPI00106D52F3|nr:hypothetical protein [Cryobacterium sp. Sr8]TFD79896.1 hypothetical protein E3T54_04350 [Cryobacterium sp. Sr8]
MSTSSRPPRLPGRHPVRRRALAAIAMLAVPLALAAGNVAFGAGHVSAATVSVAEARYLGEVDGFEQRRLRAVGLLAVAESVLASAELTLNASAGKVLAPAARTTLAEGIRAEQYQLDLVREELKKGYRLVDPAAPVTSRFSARLGFYDAASVLRGHRFAEAADLSTVRAHLAGPVQAVKDAVLAWQTEQKRLAAVKAAKAAAAARAAEAARAAAARAPARAWQAPAAAGQPRAGTARFNKYVWTAGWQAQIDACNGAVDLTGRYGVRVIGEHWSCGGSRFPSSGLITLSGVLSGTYRVGGVAAVLNANTQGTGNIPRGYDLLYQTCINGSNTTMSFTVLTRVG